MIPVIYENDEIYIINKPAGLAVQGGQGIVHSVDRDFAEQTGQKVYLVHRLDKDTSGLMIVAKNPFAAGKWTKLIASKLAKKEYVALCAGKMPQKNGIINENVIQHGQEKSAITKYKVENEWDIEVPTPDFELKNEDENRKNSESETSPVQKSFIHLTLLRLTLETGRMHQIRIHLAKNGCPIAGDDQHGNFKFNKQLKKILGIKRLQLAAVRLTIPLNDKNQQFEIPIPFDLKDF